MEHFTREDYKRLGGGAAERNLDGINILTVDEARRLLKAAYELEQQPGETPGMLATVVLRLFCGLRTAEVTRLDWSEIHWLDAKPYVHIPAGKAKKRRIRHVEIPANALAWLRLRNPPASGVIAPGSPKGYTRRFARIAKLARLGQFAENGEWKTAWENNDTRHSFGSYHYALHGDAMLTAKLMGHKQGDEVLFSHYRTLVKKETAAEYFGLLPEIAGQEPIPFPAAAQVG
jgi:integrase